VIRARPLHTLMSRLAWVAVVLMLCAPLLSRALHSPGVSRFAELCTTQGLKRVALDAPMAMSTAMDHGAAHADPATAQGGGDPHAMHDGEAACDYCLLAIRLLPVLAILFCWLRLPRSTGPRTPAMAWPVALHAWPAHPARGPPLAA
jgi:hypothetical protein